MSAPRSNSRRGHCWTGCSRTGHSKTDRCRHRPVGIGIGSGAPITRRRGNGGLVNLKGRKSGANDLKGFLIIVHPNASRGLTSNIQGGTTLEMEGMIYAPTKNILITGNGTSNANSQMFALVAKSFEFRGNGIFNYKPRQSTSNLPDIIPVRTTTVTTTTTTTSNAVSRVNLK